MSKATELNLKIGGMHCASCVNSIEQGVRSLDGVAECRVNLAVRSASVAFDRSRLSEEQIIDCIRQLGFEAAKGQPDMLTANRTEESRSRREFLTSAALAAPLMIIAMWPMLTGEPLHSHLGDGLAQAALVLALFVLGGRRIFADALLQARHFRLNMNSLVAMGTLAAFGWSTWAVIRIWQGVSEPLYFESAGMIITLILLGRMLEGRARRQAGSAIEELLRLQPTTTTAVINDVEVEIEAAAAKPGMTLLVRPGERIPADGEVLDGTPTVDESVLTGESMPVDKRVGETVIGGSLNGNAPFKLRVTATGESSFLQQVVRLVQDAQSVKAPVQKLADRVAAVFVPIVVGVAVLTGVVWYLLAPDSPMLIRSVISVLIIACPCAMGLATPTAVLTGTGRGAREGIIIKGGDILEAMTRVDALVFDKTGTLTEGQIEVVEVKAVGQVPEQNLIRLAGSAEQGSEHPVGQAIARYMDGRQITPAVVKNMESRPGFGIVADCDGRRIVVGNRSLMEKEEVGFGPSLLSGEREMEKGRTVVFVAMDGQVIGVIALADHVRPEARDVIDSLKGRLHKIAMLSGDNRKTAAGVARALGLDDFEAEIKPHQKQLLVESYRRAGYTVAMIGDGVNDAPALAAADVGVAVGSGTGVAIEAADVVLVGSNLTAITRMFALARRTLRVIKQNLFWAFAYNVVAIPVAAGALYPVFGLTLSPMIAALAMSFSSVFVVSNSLRLRSFDM